MRRIKWNYTWRATDYERQWRKWIRRYWNLIQRWTLDTRRSVKGKLRKHLGLRTIRNCSSRITLRCNRKRSGRGRARKLNRDWIGRHLATSWPTRRIGRNYRHWIITIWTNLRGSLESLSTLDHYTNLSTSIFAPQHSFYHSNL